MLMIEHLHYKYDKESIIINDISLHILLGERVLIMGPSGCGKTTLLKLMSGLLELQSGMRKLNCQHLHEQSFIFQDNQLVDYLNVLENTLLPAWCIQGKFPYHLQEQAYTLLKDFGLAQKETAYPHQLSGGQQQRVGIVRSLLSKPKIIFADEPTGQLDDQTTAKTMELLTTYCKNNECALVMVSHDSTLIKYVDSVYYMYHQQLHKQGIS
jgi:putative ABC transport system ATP-binding protein